MRFLKSCFGVPINSFLYRKTSYRIALSHYRFRMCCVCTTCCVRTKVTICGKWTHMGTSQRVHCRWKNSHYSTNNVYLTEPQQFLTLSHVLPVFSAFGHLSPRWEPPPPASRIPESWLTWHWTTKALAGAKAAAVDGDLPTRRTVFSTEINTRSSSCTQATRRGPRQNLQPRPFVGRLMFTQQQHIKGEAVTTSQPPLTSHCFIRPSWNPQPLSCFLRRCAPSLLGWHGGRSATGGATSPIPFYLLLLGLKPLLSAQVT